MQEQRWLFKMFCGNEIKNEVSDIKKMLTEIVEKLNG